MNREEAHKYIIENINLALNKKNKKIKKILEQNKEEIIKRILSDDEKFLKRELKKEIEIELKDFIQTKMEDIILPYHSHKSSKFAFHKYYEDEPDVYFGVELETVGSIENHLLIEDYPEFSAEEDSSLSNGGFEIVSDPMTMTYWKKNKPRFANMLNKLIENGQNIDDTCGFHIHVSRKAFKKKEDVFRVVRIVKFFQNELEIFANRKNNSDYYEYKGKAHPFLWMRDYEDENELKESRYLAVNLQNKETVEFRIFKGTLDIDYILAAIELVNNLINLSEHDSISIDELFTGRYIKKYLNNNAIEFKDKTYKNEIDYKQTIDIIEDTLKYIEETYEVKWNYYLNIKTKTLAFMYENINIEIRNNTLTYYDNKGIHSEIFYRRTDEISVSERLSDILEKVSRKINEA